MSLQKFMCRYKFTYKFYLYYNLYYRHKALLNRKNYSQYGEDIFISEFFKTNTKGFYVDIGSFHPLMYNNTALLYKKGWTGINIDLNQTTVDLFNIVRPKDQNICAAISAEEKKVNLFFEHNFSPLNTINNEFFSALNMSESKQKKFETKLINTTSFESAIKHLVKIPRVNFLNIDVEGSEKLVLDTMDWDIPVYIICIELDDHNSEKDEYCRKLLQSKGFSLKFRLCINEFWINDNYFRKDLLFEENGKNILKNFKEFNNNYIEPYIKNKIIFEINNYKK